MINIHEKEDDLYDRWLIMSKDLGDGDNLAPDGLLYRGELHVSTDEDSYWAIKRGDEEKKWETEPKRLLIVTKDLNNIDEDGSEAEAWDIRVETGLKNDIHNKDYESCICFYKRLRMWAYGLLNIDKDGNYPSFKEARNMKNSGPFYMEAPIARINCKKQCGSSSIPDAKLLSFMENYKDLLIENLKIYERADIILCCAGSGIIKNFIRDNYLTDLIGIPTPNETNDNYWIYYSPSTKKVIINGWHPSARREYEGVYNRMMEAYSYFIKNQDKLNL